MIKRHPAPLADPHNVADAFASGVDVQDYEDWVRLLGWAECQAIAGDGFAREDRRICARIVMPRSAVPELVRALRQSVATHREAQRH